MSRAKWVLPILALGGASCCLLLPCVERVRDGEGWKRSQFTLRCIGFALLQYHDTYHRLPPAVVGGKDGKPLYSWRVVLLPFIDETPLYEKFRLDQPWNSPHNKKLLEVSRNPYQPILGGIDEPRYLTRYQVLVGPGTAFERDGLVLPGDFPDGVGDTILVAEAGEPVPWSAPQDMTYDPNKPLPPLSRAYTKARHEGCGMPLQSVSGFNAVFADGSARFLSNRTDEKVIRALITRNGVEQVDPSQLE